MSILTKLKDILVDEINIFEYELWYLQLIVAGYSCSCGRLKDDELYRVDKF